MYAIVDIETTGGSPETSKIIEIAIVVHDGREVVKQYSSLVNPGCPVPYFITRITGITDEMLDDAPPFYEIAKEIVELTEDRVFVAHNVRFDYGFLKTEFRNLGYDYRRKTLCTVRLSRQAFMGLPSYSLGNLCESLNIKIENRHRALGDAEATAILFSMIIESDCDLTKHEKIKSEIQKISFPPLLNKNSFDIIPSSVTGIYYLHDKEGNVIYIGKSKDIKKRLLQHFANGKSKKSVHLYHEISDISFENTGSELIALLLESDEIKKIRPVFNTSQKRTKAIPGFGIYERLDENGYINLFIEAYKKDAEPISTSDNMQDAKNVLFRAIEKFRLCYAKCGLSKSGSACFNLQIHNCEGACINKEDAESYNGKVYDAVNSFSFHNQSFFIVDRGRNTNEKSIVYVERGEYKGFGFVEHSISQSDPDQLKDYIKKYNHNKDIQHILVQYLKKGGKKIIMNSEESI